VIPKADGNILKLSVGQILRSSDSYALNSEFLWKFAANWSSLPDPHSCS
jgi:hypothetical protein